MAVACRRCGRHYDVTLFEYGRTIDCTCGERVGLEHMLEVTPVSIMPRFIADAMLERLARWLRIVGFDCAFERGIADAELVRRAIAERRVVLTRDRGLLRDWRVAGLFLVEATSTREQLAEVIARFDLARRLQPFTRCSRCNAVVEPVEAREITERVPERILAVYDRFIRCPSCDRVYWAGTHADRMQTVIDGLIADARPGLSSR